MTIEQDWERRRQQEEPVEDPVQEAVAPEDPLTFGELWDEAQRDSRMVEEFRSLSREERKSLLSRMHTVHVYECSREEETDEHE